MRRGLSRQAWVSLILITAALVNWGLMELHPLTGRAGVRYLGATILVVAFAKAWLVIDNFMEVREAPRPLRLALAAWTVVVCGSLIVQLVI